MKERQKKILLAIIESYISSAEPIGSKNLLDKYNFHVSSSTIRNEMAILEEANLIYQPHTSSGRIPTTTGYRMFIDSMLEENFPEISNIEQNLETEIKNSSKELKLRNIASTIANFSQNVGFSFIPSDDAYFLGVSNFLMQPEFQNTHQASTIIRILEDKDKFAKILASLPISDTVSVFVGQEHILPEIQSCSIIVTKTKIAESMCYIGILGPTRMDYARNVALLKTIKKNDY